MRKKGKFHRKQDEEQPHEALLTTLFVTGMILLIWEMFIFDITVINLYVPVLIWFVSGVFFALLCAKYLLRFTGWSGALIYGIANTAGLGGYLVFLFMAANCYLPSGNKAKVIETNILKTGMVKRKWTSCETLYAEVIIDNTPKYLNFSCDTDFSDYTKVRLRVRKGALGYYIVLDQTLVP